jgi:hypothetical protein
MPAEKYGVAACAIGIDIYVFGGEDNDSEYSRTVFKFDTEANEWSTLAQMPHGCFECSASVLDGQVYIVGAHYGDEVLRFNPVSQAWISLASTSTGRQNGVSFVLGGCCYAAGGLVQIPSVERYDVASNTWTAVANLLGNRFFVNVATIV